MIKNRVALSPFLKMVECQSHQQIQIHQINLFLQFLGSLYSRKCSDIILFNIYLSSALITNQVFLTFQTILSSENMPLQLLVLRFFLLLEIQTSVDENGKVCSSEWKQPINRIIYLTIPLFIKNQNTLGFVLQKQPICKIYINLNIIIIIQMQTYYINQKQLKDCVDAQNWQQIDKQVPQIPQGFYSFRPKQQLGIYYQRLLYCLNNEQTCERAYKLTKYLLLVNTNNYYAMMLRNECRKQTWQKLSEAQEYYKNAKNELYFVNCLLVINPKQYQNWNYKKDIINECFAFSVEHLDDGKQRQSIKQQQQEFLFYLMTNDDEKNYHAWDFKTWLSRKFDCLQKAIQQTQSMLFLSNTVETDPGLHCESLWKDCYSCWSFRFNLIIDLPLQKRVQFINKDAQKVHGFILKNPYSQCGWNYLTGLLERKQVDENNKQQIVKQIYQVCKVSKTSNRFAWTLILNLGTKQMKTQALSKLFESDPIRRLYYQYLKQNNPDF